MKAKEIIAGKKYYFGKSKKSFKCTSVGNETSFFVDYLNIEHHFYNEDIYIDKYNKVK